MKILIVEDEVKTAEYLKRGFQEAGYTVNVVTDGLDGFHHGCTDDHDLVILDVMLPRMDGWQILAAWRVANRHMPVLLLTAKEQVQDRVRGLELGADDYLVKPFSFAELLARVRTIMRRGRVQQELTSLTVADLELDLVRRRVQRGALRVELTAKEFGLLELLMRRSGEVLPRSLIASLVRDMNFDSDSNAVEVAVRRLRAKIDDEFEVKLLRTVRGMGYVLEAPAAQP